MSGDIAVMAEEFRRDAQEEGRAVGLERKPAVQRFRAWLCSEGASWPRDMSAHEHEALVREFTIVRAHICGIPMGSYGTPGHRDLAQKALHLTKMERALCEDKPGFAPVEYVDVILAYWTTLASKRVTYRFLVLLAAALDELK